MERVVPADDHSKDAIPRGKRQQSKEPHLIHVLEAKPPQTEVADAPQSEKKEDSEEPALPRANGSGPAVPEHFTGGGPGSLGTRSQHKRR